MSQTNWPAPCARIPHLYPVLWEKISKTFTELDEVDRLQVAELVVDTCGSCREASARCQCWNDR